MADSPPPPLTWSAQFTVASSKTVLGGDKILLPPSALEQLLSASSAHVAEHTRRHLPTYDPYNSSTFSAYRQAESQYQDQRQQLPHPLTFRVVNPENGRVVYAGIREFSAEEGKVSLSPFLSEALGIHGDGMDECNITVHLKELPRGEFVKLRPLEAGYDPDDWKALLEQHLRQNYTTLTNGEVLIVPGGRRGNGGRDEFRFLVDGFHPEVDGICVVDTDLEVDIEALNEEQARETLTRIAAKLTKPSGTERGSSPGGELHLFQAQTGQVLAGEYVDYELPSWNRALPMELELEVEDGEEDVNLLASPLSATQRSKPRIDEFVFADLDPRPTKRIRLEPRNVEMENAEALYVSIYAFAPSEDVSNGHSLPAEARVRPRRFTLRARHPEVEKQTASISAEIPPNEGDVRCENCTQWVPQRTLMLHQNFCLRNNIICPHGCGQVFPKRSPQFESHWHCPHDPTFGNTTSARTQHDTIFHPSAILRCPECSTAETFSNLPSLAHHRTTTCPAKPILCRFCHLVVPQEGDPDVPNAEALLSGMTVHELADGARTTECHLCAKIVRLRDMETHLRNHDLDRWERPPPVPCRNELCGRTIDTCARNGDTRAGTRMGQGPGNDVGLCSVCFGPLYVSTHDPEGKALKRRVERRYLQQLLTGCGRAWCGNVYCRSGRTNLHLPANISTKEALPMINPFLDGLSMKKEVGGDRTPLHFCTDEGSQRRREMAAILASEDDVSGKGGYALEWCVGALEACGGDLEGARAWLRNWAPGRGEARRL